MSRLQEPLLESKSNATVAARPPCMTNSKSLRKRDLRRTRSTKTPGDGLVGPVAEVGPMLEAPALAAEPADLPLGSDGVSPTDLRLVELCPLQLWHAARWPSETAAPSLGLAIGQVVHAAREAISKEQRGIYLEAESESKLWSEGIEARLRALIEFSFERHYYLQVFGDSAARARLEWSDRLLGLERARAVKARDAWNAGLRGVDLANACTPERTEAEWFDSALMMHGFCDELWRDGKKARPVELKTSPPSVKNRTANRFQVAAYAYLAQNVEGLEVSTCEVQYLREGSSDRFRFGPSWERRVRGQVHRVMLVRHSLDPPAGAPTPQTCGWCPFQQVCPESAAPSVEDAFVSLKVFDGFGSR